MPHRWRGCAGSLRSQVMGCLEGPASGSGECGLVAGIDGAEGEWRDSLRRN